MDSATQERRVIFASHLVNVRSFIRCDYFLQTSTGFHFTLLVLLHPLCTYRVNQDFIVITSHTPNKRSWPKRVLVFQAPAWTWNVSRVQISFFSFLSFLCCYGLSGPIEQLTDYNRIRGGMYWLRLWTRDFTISCSVKCPGTCLVVLWFQLCNFVLWRFQCSFDIINMLH